MERETAILGIYRGKPQLEDAVDKLLATGIAGDSIFVLFPKNKDSAAFAERKHTHAPVGTSDGPTADLPLDGTIGVADPQGFHHALTHFFLYDYGHPREGALHGALAQMGVPDEWCNKRVVRGKMLVSVKCKSWDDFFRVAGVFTFTGAIDMSWPASLDRIPEPSH